MDLTNKVVLLTGASTGIGSALIHELCKHQIKLVLIARRVELIEKEMGNANFPPDNYLILKCDVSDKSEVEAAYKKAVERFERIDIAILNAGVSGRMPIEQYNSLLAEKTFGANIFGIVYWTERLLPEFLKRKSGMIVGVSSMADNRGYSGSSFYSASKAAVTTLLEGLRIELLPFNIKVLTVKPGFIKTPMTDKNEFYMPFLMPVNKAAQIITKGIIKEKRLIKFPLPMFLITRFIGFLPGGIYEFFASFAQKKMIALHKK